MMELWRKNKVNPLGGCLPALVQMPIWFALYATLQTAVEMYHTKFLWFTDLSAPDKFFILPLVLGAAMIVQQRIVPQQGMDPVQAKMMTYLMPGVFTVMMLFLPAALGVYMLTNSVLGITQQLVVEKLFPRAGAPAPSAEIVVKSENKTGRATLGKGKAVSEEQSDDRGRPQACRRRGDARSADAKALAFVRMLVGKMQMDAEVNVAPGRRRGTPDEIRLEIEGPDAGRIIGKKGSGARGHPVPDGARRRPPGRGAAARHRRRRGLPRAPRGPARRRWRGGSPSASPTRARSSRSTR